GQVEVRPPVGVAVEHGDAATDRERVLAVVGVRDTGRRRDIHELRRPEGGACYSPTRAREREPADDRGDDRHDHDAEGGEAPRTWPHRGEDSEGREDPPPAAVATPVPRVPAAKTASIARRLATASS